MNAAWEVAGRAVQAVRIELPSSGAWVAQVSCTGDAPLPTSVDIECANGGGKFHGHVTSQTSTRGYVSAYVVGGNGKLNTAVSAKGYKNTTSAIVARELCGDAGESFDPASTAAATLPFYCRIASTLADTLHVLTNTTGEPWRVTRAGAVYLGNAPTTEHTTKAFFITHDEVTDSDVFAVDYPEFAPGQTLNGRTIVSILYELNGSLRATVFYK